MPLHHVSDGDAGARRQECRWHNLRMPRSMGVARAPLGGLGQDQFLREYWQKKPLLIRQAIEGFSGWLSRRELLALARKSEVESRLVRRQRGRWHFERGPFRALPSQPRNWTLLVQGVNQYDQRVDDLMRRFAMVPFSRLDDVMVSYAADGGGVGPHVDAYDVFLLQA